MALVAVVAKLVTSKKGGWQGLTEAELREKLDSRLPSQMPDEKRAAVADKVVTSMQKRGAISPDADEPDDAGTDSEDVAVSEPTVGDDGEAEDAETN